MKKFFALAIAACCALSAQAQSGWVSLGWKNGANASATTNWLTYCRIGISSLTYTGATFVRWPSTNLMVTNLVVGQRYYFAVYLSDTVANTPDSNEVSWNKMNGPILLTVIANGP